MSYEAFGDTRPGGIKEVYEAKILICYLLSHVKRPMTGTQLLEIATQDELINYFLLSDALKGLVEKGQLLLETPVDGGEPYYSLTEQGISGANEFKSYVPRALRDRIVDAALRMFARIKRDEEVKCELLALEDGYHVHCRMLDIGSDLLELKLFAPDKEQAELIRKKILADPSGFYCKLMGYCLDNDSCM